ncbi:MAG: hypothetical protein M1838_004648 [Thelocarpon superellum]|nr:MAG: hypothetical protein M1838_004648 [Thelocarpon superellum]
MDRRETSSLRKTQYLVAYNFANALLWLSVLGRVVLLLPLVGHNNVYGGVGEFTKWIQTAALLEVCHAMLGLVRAAVFTTALQVASRILVVWFVVEGHVVSQTSPVYSSMLVAWSMTEIVRYSYFVLNLQGSVPSALTWLRYNLFFVLYPMGIGSEMWLMYLTSEDFGKTGRKELQWSLRAVLLLYPIGAYILYTHMMTQRRKVLRGKQRQ